MAYDYDKLYGENPNALGEQSPEISAFFAKLKQQNLNVLDVGCGQGRDAIPIARLGHKVTALDLSANGIKDILEVAKNENLSISGIVADITNYIPHEDYDVLLIDRTLHMLDRVKRLASFERLIANVNSGGWLLLLDEKSNMPDFIDILGAHKSWHIQTHNRGTLIAQKG